MAEEQVIIGGENGRALGDVLDDIISKSSATPGQAPQNPNPPVTDPGTSAAQAAAPVETQPELTETPPAEAVVAAEGEPLKEKVKVKILPDELYEVVGDDGQTRELDGKSLLGEMMLRSEFNRKTTDVKKIEEEAKSKIAEAEQQMHWVNLVARNKFLTLATQAVDKGSSEEDAIKYAASATGIDLAKIAGPVAAQVAPPEDPRAKILDGVESDDPGYAEKLQAYTDYKSELAETRAYNRIKAEQAAEKLQQSEAQKVIDAENAEKQKRIDSIVAYNNASIATVDTYLAQKFGDDFTKLSKDERKPIYDKITDFMATKGLDLRSKEFLTSNLITERDIEYGVGFAFPQDFSLKSKAAQTTQASTAPQPPGMNTNGKLPLNAGAQSQAIPPIEARLEPTPTETLNKSLDDIIAKAK